MATRYQKFGAWTQAGWSMVTTGKFKPLNDGTNALVQYVTPVDESGNALSSPVLSAQNALTVTASSAYASGNVVGTLQTIANAVRVAGGGGLIQSVETNIKSAQTSQIDVIFFNANPTNSTFTDKTAVAVNVLDFDKVLGVAHVTDWTSLGTPSVGQVQNLAMPFVLAATTLYYVCVTRGTPTFTATTDVSVGVKIIQS